MSAQHISAVLEQTLTWLKRVRSGAIPLPPWAQYGGWKFESPLEQDFAWHAIKYLHDRVLVQPQFRVTTPAGNFRADFMLTDRRGRKVGIECDGKDYHQDPARDLARDRAILDSGALHAIYRLRGQDLFWHTEDVLLLLAQREPQLFSDKGVRNLKTQAHERIVNALDLGEQVIVQYHDEETGLDSDLVMVIRDRKARTPRREELAAQFNEESG